MWIWNFDLKLEAKRQPWPKHHYQYGKQAEKWSLLTPQIFNSILKFNKNYVPETRLNGVRCVNLVLPLHYFKHLHYQYGKQAQKWKLLTPQIFKSILKLTKTMFFKYAEKEFGVWISCYRCTILKKIPLPYQITYFCAVKYVKIYCKKLLSWTLEVLTYTDYVSTLYKNQIFLSSWLTKSLVGLQKSQKKFLNVSFFRHTT